MERKEIKDNIFCLNYEVYGKTVDEVITLLKEKQAKILEDPRYIRVELAKVEQEDYYRDHPQVNIYIVGVR